MSNYQLTFFCHIFRNLLTGCIFFLIGLFLVVWFFSRDKRAVPIHADYTERFKKPPFKEGTEDLKQLWLTHKLQPNTIAVYTLSDDTVMLLSKVNFLFSLGTQSWQVKYKDKTGVFRTTTFPAASLRPLAAESD